MISFGMGSRSRTLWVCSSCKAKFSTFAKHQTVNGFRHKPSQKVPDKPARTRFAPSPTGYLHLGSLRTALFNYLLAKRTGGTFLLRLEDTDKKRTVQGAEEQLYRDLKWAGLLWSEGPIVGGPYGPYRQSDRTAIYQEHAEQLLQSGNAYRCFCSAERLYDLGRQRNKLGLPTEYDRACASIPVEESNIRAANGESHIIRMRAPDQYPDFTDLVYGKIGKGRMTSIHYKQGQVAYEDPVLLKSDGMPTYHLANVVDDHHMKITHVIRAAEWISSTPKHLALYGAFGWRPPLYAHVGLLEDDNHRKLSKRNHDIDISSYAKKGIFPEALLNFAALLGWSHNHQSDVMELGELIQNFDLHFTKGNTIVAFGKLWYLQKAHAQRYILKEGKQFESMITLVKNVVEARILQSECTSLLQTDEPQSLLMNWNGSTNTRNESPWMQDLRAYIGCVLRMDSKNYTEPVSFFERNDYFFKRIRQGTSFLVDHVVPAKMDFDMLLCLRNNLFFGPWTAFAINERIGGVLREYGLDQQTKEKTTLSEVEMKEVHKTFHTFLRWAITGGKPGPSISNTMEVLGKQETFWRLEAAAGSTTALPKGSLHDAQEVEG